MLIETINALNLEAVAAYFVADVTHTWPGHSGDVAADGRARRVRRCAGRLPEPRPTRNAQDFAVWAVKSGDVAH